MDLDSGTCIRTSNVNVNLHGHTRMRHLVIVFFSNSMSRYLLYYMYALPFLCTPPRARGLMRLFEYFPNKLFIHTSSPYAYKPETCWYYS